MLAGHSAIGLAFAALVYVVCLSGTILVFRHELERWEAPQGPLLDTVSPEIATRAMRTANDHALASGGADSLYLSLPDDQSPRLQVNTYNDRESDKALVFDAAGEPVRQVDAPWTDALARLHFYLHLPVTWGSFIVGLTGVSLLSSLISGLLSHPRIVRDAFALRWGGSRRLQEADLHNRLGVWGLPFHMVASLTGALLGLSTLVFGVLSIAAYGGDRDKAQAALFGPNAPTLSAPAALPDLAALMTAVHQTHPKAELMSAYISGLGTTREQIDLEARSPGHLALGQRFTFDGAGRLVGDSGAETGSVGQRILGMLQPLHFGWYGGILVKLAYGALGLALTVITTSGVMIWLARRRDKGRPAPVWERIWAATVWSQPLGLGLAAIASPFAGASWMLALYLSGLALAAFYAALIADGSGVSRSLRLTGGSILAAAGLLHAVTWGERMTDPAGWCVDLAFILTATTLIMPLWFHRRRALRISASISTLAE